MTSTPPRKIFLAYKNFAANRNISHIGLGVAAMNTSKVLRKAGHASYVQPILNAADLDKLLVANSGQISHVVISAPWIPIQDLQQLVNTHQDTVFSVNCHSNVGFLQADSNGVALLRQCLLLEKGVHNFHVSGNSFKFARWITSAYQAPCLYLPNLYYLDHTVVTNRPLYNGGILRIGIFGATRPLKNMLSGVAAAIEISQQMKVPTEIWYSGGRVEGDSGNVILRAAQALTAGLPLVSLKSNNWQSWPEFVNTVGSMHLLLQPSYTESFNMVTADGISKGVPSVVSDAIDWAPEYWQASVDDVFDIANRGRMLLFDSLAAENGLAHLKAHNRRGMHDWNNFLTGNPHTPGMQA